MMLASGGSVNDANPSHQEVDDNMDVDVEMMEMEAGGGVPPAEPAHDLDGDEISESFDPYSVLNDMSDEDLEDLEEIKLIMSQKTQERRFKWYYERKNWHNYTEGLIYTNEFENRYRMEVDEFDHLMEGLRDAITVNYTRSYASTQGNDPMYPEVIMACGLRYLGLGDGVAALSDIHGYSKPSVKRAINLFLDAVDYNEDIPELQIALPDPNDEDAIHGLATRWSDLSTKDGLFNYHVAALDGWLPRTEMPSDVDNKGDYFSGHYQCFGLNVQAMCGPDLLFLYLCIAAPGKTNDIRAFEWCEGLKSWLDSLPDEYFISADNAYSLSRRILIPFSGAEASIDHNRTYNYYLSQLRIRIEMTFGLLTTKWRRLRMTLNCTSEKNAKIIRVCAKLHNYCIRMKQTRGETYAERFHTDRPEPSRFGIAPLNDGGNRRSDWGFLETERDGEGETERSGEGYSSLSPDTTRRAAIVADIKGRTLRRPSSNVRRNSV